MIAALRSADEPAGYFQPRDTGIAGMRPALERDRRRRTCRRR